MISTNIHEAKTHLSRWVELASQGEEIIICKNGKPAVCLVPYVPKVKPRQSGLLKGQISISDDFDELPEDFMKYFE